MNENKVVFQVNARETALFHVEHLAKTSCKRRLRLVRTVPGHLMRPSKAKDEFSEAGTCRALDENKPEAKSEVSAKNIY